MSGNDIRALGVCAALAVFGCGDGRTRETVSGDGRGTGVAGGEVSRSRPGTTRVVDIIGNQERYTGRTVTVEGDVDAVLSPFAFTIDDGLYTGGVDTDLIVTYPRSLNLETFDAGWRRNKVRVRGTVRRMTVADFERYLGRDLSSFLEAEFMRQPVLIARSVERLDRP